jgi:hypothetical protein
LDPINLGFYHLLLSLLQIRKLEKQYGMMIPELFRGILRLIIVRMKNTKDFWDKFHNY